ncbi:amino acid adenylation domain-containing protein [Brevibacillus sp. GCM10020057]|uniref:non-ribosomal peptide synthetase n=1 Tax=Brevibacillus sp. GCM10020057 TaxID=3317327 RepID=UPI0036253344
MKNVLLEQGGIEHEAGSPLSIVQEHLWKLMRGMDGDSAAAAVPVRFAWRISGPLQVELLEQCLAECVERHDMLRAAFLVRDGVPMQIIRPVEKPVLHKSDLRQLSAEEAEARARHSVDEVTDECPLWTCLAQLAEQEFLLTICVHPLVADEQSMQLVMQEVLQGYQARLRGQKQHCPQLNLSYTGCREREERRIAEPQAEADLAYWQQKLGEEPPEQYLPADYPRTSRTVFATNTCHFAIPSSLQQSLYAFVRQEQTSLLPVVLTVLHTLLHRYNGEEETRIAVLLPGRDADPEMANVVGCFASPLVLPHVWQSDPTFRAALHHVQQSLAEGMAHQQFPAARLIDQFGRKSRGGSPPLYRLLLEMVSLQTWKDESGLQVWEVDVGASYRPVELAVRIAESAEGLSCSMTYAATLFKEETIIRMGGHFFTLLAGVLAAPDEKVSTAPLLTTAERTQLLIEWNRAAVSYPRDASIPELFEEQVRLRPDHPALLFGDQVMTYRQLNQRADEIAARLCQLEIADEQLVAVCLDRSPDMIASYLAVLKAGGAYVPIDLTYPPERIAYMLEDSAASLVITTERIAKDLPRLPPACVFLDADCGEAVPHLAAPRSRSRAESLAYVMYTSGSTGKPKGVMIDHRGIVRLVKNIDYASVGPDETYMNLGAVAFDVSAFEIYGALLNGGKLVILSANKPTFAEIARTIQHYGVTSLNVTPDRLNVLLEDYSEALRGLRQVMPGGEALPVWLARKCREKLPNARLINLYGPTENAVNTTSYHVEEIPLHETTIPIGRPIGGDRLYILDRQLQPVPIGVIGDLCMSGDGIARGYLNRPELTNERFLPDPFSETPGQRMYKSGDLARYRADGNVEFIGRADDQVKIRGCRIELGEIETIVGQYPGVRQAVAGVTKAKDGTAALAAYVVMNADASFSEPELRAYVRARLPEYMIPTFFIELAEVPVTPVGKIDRKRLPAPVIGGNQERLVPPRNAMEEKLVRVWEHLLEVRPIGVTDSFFQLGGNSLLAMRMFSQLEKTFGKRLSVSSVFQEDTIEKLARLLASSEEHAELTRSLVPIQPLGTEPPLFCIHGGGGEVLVYGELAKVLGEKQPLYGLRYAGTGEQGVTVEALAQKYLREIREVQPKGPYHLIGFCLGGAIAYEMAQQLLQEGERVGLLTILNYVNPGLPALGLARKIYRSVRLMFRLPRHLRDPFVLQKLRYAVQVLKKTGDDTSFEQANIQELVAAMRQYRPKPYPGRLLLIRAMTQLHPVSRLGWETTETGEIEEHCMAADHGTLLKEPNATLLAKYIQCHVRKEFQPM